MKKNELIAVVLMFLATVGTVVGIFAIEGFRRSQFYSVTLTARAPEHGNWEPGNISLPLGKKARILIRNIDTVSHGFTLPDFNVGAGEIKAGEVQVVEFTPDKAGVFPFMCTVWCSERHLEMKGQLEVTP